MKQLRYVVSLAFVGAALTVVPAVQQAAAGDTPASASGAVREPSWVNKVREGSPHVVQRDPAVIAAYLGSSDESPLHP